MKLLYQFSAGDSFLHRLDPRTKLVFVVCFLISTFLLPHPWVMPLVIIAIIWILGRVSPLEYFVFILFLLPLMTAIVLIHLLTDGPPYFDARLLGVIPISTPGWDAGLLVAFRLAAMGIAMELRGFNYAETVGARRTVFRDIRMRPRDYAVVAVSLLGLVAAVGLSVLLGAFPEIPRAWLVFLSILLVLFSAIAWRISRTIKG